MKKIFLLLLLALGFNAAKAQSLKDLLYSGKLKNDSNSVVKRTDDLSTKIDTSTRKPAEAEKPRAAVTPAPAATTATTAKPETTAGTAATGNTTDSAATEVATENVAQPVAETPAPVRVKSNTRIWKEYTDSLVAAMKTEVLSSKKVKKESYYLTVEHEIAPDGQVSILNVTCAPENEFLQNQVKDRIISSTPVLAPATDSNNQARKVKRRYNFTITKE